MPGILGWNIGAGLAVVVLVLVAAGITLFVRHRMQGPGD